MDLAKGRFGERLMPQHPFTQLVRGIYVDLPGGPEEKISRPDLRICLKWPHAEALWEAARSNDEKALIQWARCLANQVRKVL